MKTNIFGRVFGWIFGTGLGLALFLLAMDFGNTLRVGAPMAGPQPGDGVWILTARHGVITQVPAKWHNFGFAEGVAIWLAEPLNEPDTAIVTGREK